MRSTLFYPDMKQELKTLLFIVFGFAVLFFMPVGNGDFMAAVQAALDLAKWYAQEHVLLCLVPAFFIAGVISVFVSKGAVLRFFGASAPKWLSYSVAAVSGSILAVCSCTILPLFTGIYKRGAGLGPAVAFLYSGPAISVLSIILTARILGVEMGVARAVGAIGFSLVIGLAMAFIFRHEKREEGVEVQTGAETNHPVGQVALLFFTLVGILVFANWGAPGVVCDYKWHIVGALGLLLCWELIEHLHLRALWVGISAVAVALSLVVSMRYAAPAFKALPPMVVGTGALALMLLCDRRNRETQEWAIASWGFAKQMLPLLAAGVLTAGFLLGSTHGDTALPGIIPSDWVSWALGGNGLASNFFASFAGAFMYFATLTEIPIIQGLLSAGMGKGPALALLLAGPSLSLPNMLVIHGVLGMKKTAVYVILVILLATLAGYTYGTFFP